VTLRVNAFARRSRLPLFDMLLHKCVSVVYSKAQARRDVLASREASGRLLPERLMTRFVCSWEQLAAQSASAQIHERPKRNQASAFACMQSEPGWRNAKASFNGVMRWIEEFEELAAIPG
jgi:hypothetical protein